VAGPKGREILWVRHKTREGGVGHGLGDYSGVAEFGGFSKCGDIANPVHQPMHVAIDSQRADDGKFVTRVAAQQLRHRLSLGRLRHFDRCELETLAQNLCRIRWRRRLAGQCETECGDCRPEGSHRDDYDNDRLIFTSFTG
jgi:hypothetical protein